MFDKWPRYVSVAKRRAAAARVVKTLRKQGIDIEPIEIHGRKIVTTFWGSAWCKHLEKFSDFANRLPRGRAYVRDGFVCNLVVKRGKIKAIVSGSMLYNVVIDIAPLPPARWKRVRAQCTGQIASVLELLQGKLSRHVMEVVTDAATGLFPKPKEIKLHCDCPDWAVMCKHVAAVLYGIGVRLDEKPQLLFLLRQVDHEELITVDLNLPAISAGHGKRRVANQDLSAIFGIEMDEIVPPRTRRDTAKHKPKRTQRDIKRGKQSAARGKVATGSQGKAMHKAGFTPTGTAVTQLRARLGMTRAEFAQWLAVAPQTVVNWESKRGQLKLQRRTLGALTRAWAAKNPLD